MIKNSSTLAPPYSVLLYATALRAIIMMEVEGG